MKDIFVFIVSLIHVFNFAFSQPCSWPSAFTDTLWHDSDRGQITFTDTTVSGWDATVQGGVVLEEWECYISNVTSVDTLTLIFKATTTVTIFQTVYVTFACLQMTSFSENAFYYYQMAGEEPRLSYDRLIVLEEDSLLTDQPTEDRLCSSSSSSNAPTTNEYHVIIRNDKTENAIRSCPEDFIGTHKYTVTDSSSTYCGGGDTSWDVCTNTDTMVFSYSLCSTNIAYSEQGIVNCVFERENADYRLVTVMTKEITSTERFTCFSSYLAANGSLFVSQSPGSCSKSQTPFTIPTSSDGSVTGLKMVLTDKASCGTTTSTTTSTTSTTTTSTTTTTTTTTSTTTTTPTTTSTTTTTPTTTTTTTTTTTPSPTTSTSTTTPTTSTSTTTTSTSTTTTTPTTTVTTTTQRPSSSNKTAMYIAIVTGCVAVVLLLILAAICAKMFCCKEKQPRPKTPDLNIETLPHTTAGYGGIPWALSNAPRETTIIENETPEKDILVFPQATSNDFTMTVPRNSSFVDSYKSRGSFPSNQIMPRNDVKKVSSVNIPVWEVTPVPAILPSKTSTVTPAVTAIPVNEGANYVSSSINQNEVTKTVKVFDGIIMDETVNFALRYSSRMKSVRKDWYERRHSGSSLISEKTVCVPFGRDSDSFNTRRVSITDISETSLFENSHGIPEISPPNVFQSFSDTGTSSNNMRVSPVSEISLPVSPVDSVSHLN